MCILKIFYVIMATDIEESEKSRFVELYKIIEASGDEFWNC